jgi:uncharacterized protein (TIGR03792 family)
VADGWRNTKRLVELERPLAVEHLVYEVRPEAYERWKAAEYEFWTKGEADRFPFYVGKEMWLKRGDPYKVTIIIYWDSVEAWHSIDAAWLDEQERAFAEVVGAENYRLVHEGHTVDQYHKISEYR